MDRLADYLRHVGMADGPVPLRACELCGSNGFEVLRESVVVRGALRAPIRVAACGRCGLLFQLDRFDAAAYARYYAERYRLVISEALEPGEDFLQDQLSRGEHLCRRLSPSFPQAGRVVDIGCGAGGLLVAFAQRGWDAEGIDPDHRAVALGRRRFGLRLSAGVAEEMTLPAASVDLVLITGSLEHVADVNRVMSHCVSALRAGGRILLEGWGLAQARLIGGFGHNQKRYFTGASLRWLLDRHGIAVEFVTSEALCGPSRPGSVFAMGCVGAGPAGASAVEGVCDEGPAADLTSEGLGGLGIH